MAGSERPNEDRGPCVAESAVAGPGITQNFVDGYLVPVDPMDDLQCESCQ